MDLKLKIAIVAGILVLAVAGLVGVSYVFSGSAGDNVTPAISPAWTFHESDFIYGPQAWVPYYSPLSVVPASGANSSDNFKIMFVDLNISSRQGGSNNRPVVVEYAFTGLRGTAAFHVYGYNHASSNGGGLAWTNRMDESGPSGFYVTGSPGSALSEGSSVLNNHNYVRVANTVAHDDYGNGTYFLNFNKAGGGLNALRLASVPDKSEVCTTANQSGKFYVTVDSDNGFDDVLLLVAVNSTQPAGFALRLYAYPYADQP